MVIPLSLMLTRQIFHACWLRANGSVLTPKMPRARRHCPAGSNDAHGAHGAEVLHDMVED
jgi:hypothetical protein